MLRRPKSRSACSTHVVHMQYIHMYIHVVHMQYTCSIYTCSAHVVVGSIYVLAIKCSLMHASPSSGIVLAIYSPIHVYAAHPLLLICT